MTITNVMWTAYCSVGLALLLVSQAHALCQLEVKLRVFTPSPIVAHPTTPAGSLIRGVTRAFAGDGRGFSYDSGTSHAELIAKVPVKAPSDGADAAFDTSNAQQVVKFGTTREYAASDCDKCPWNIQHSGKNPKWWWEPAPSRPPKIKSTATPEQNANNLRVWFKESGSSKVEVNLVVAPDPLLMGATISANLPKFTVTLELRTDSSKSGKQVLWSAGVQGAHDGFPSYEVYVNGKRAYGYMAGSRVSPDDMFPQAGVHVWGETMPWRPLCTVERPDSGEPPRATDTAGTASGGGSFLAQCPELSPERVRDMSDADILAAMDACCTKATNTYVKQVATLTRNDISAGSTSGALVGSLIESYGTSQCASAVEGASKARQDVLVRGCKQCMQRMGAAMKG